MDWPARMDCQFGWMQGLRNLLGQFVVRRLDLNQRSFGFACWPNANPLICPENFLRENLEPLPNDAKDSISTRMHDKAKGSPKFRFHALYDRVYREDVFDERGVKTEARSSY